jgi:sugar phosphate isomerase/epimerase
MNNRRTFLKQSAMLSAGMFLVKPDMLFAKPAKLKVGIQLYSLRDYLPKDVKGTIAKVAKAGYTEVETYGYDTKTKTFWGLSAKDFKLLLSDHGITSPSGHYGIDQYFTTGKADDQQAYIDAAHDLGQSTIVVPYLNDTFRKTTEDFKTAAAKVNQIAAMNKKAGLKTGYHNHDFEFKPVNNVMLYDVLLKETDPALVSFEMDLYWIAHAKQDPVQLFKAHPGRFNMWHIKDMDKANRDINTEVGTGSVDFKKIFQYQKLSGVKHIYMEQENFSMDAYASITQSASYIKNTLLR